MTYDVHISYFCAEALSRVSERFNDIEASDEQSAIDQATWLVERDGGTTIRIESCREH